MHTYVRTYVQYVNIITILLHTCIEVNACVAVAASALQGSTELYS